MDPLDLAVERLRVAGVADAVEEARETQARAYPTVYLGTLPVAAATLGSTLWSMFGGQIACDAIKKLKRLKRSTPTKAFVTVSLDGVLVCNAAADGDVIDVELMRSVAFACVDPTNSRKVAYITHYARLGLLYCHVLQMKSKVLAAELTQAIMSLKDTHVALSARATPDLLEPQFGFGKGIGMRLSAYLSLCMLVLSVLDLL